jgi:thioredoxin-like negative regulator of GroEL
MKPTAVPGPHDWWVICLCAEWCGVCREWRELFEQLAAAHPALHFAWVDVEDEAQAMGDVDIETFPTLLVAQGNSPRFFGPVQPSAGQVSRLLESLIDAPVPSREPADAAELLKRLASALPSQG